MSIKKNIYLRAWIDVRQSVHGRNVARTLSYSAGRPHRYYIVYIGRKPHAAAGVATAAAVTRQDSIRRLLTSLSYHRLLLLPVSKSIENDKKFQS